MDTKDMKNTNEKVRFKQNIILVVLGVTLLVALMNFKTVAGDWTFHASDCRGNNRVYIERADAFL